MRAGTTRYPTYLANVECILLPLHLPFEGTDSRLNQTATPPHRQSGRDCTSGEKDGGNLPDPEEGMGGGGGGGQGGREGRGGERGEGEKRGGRA